MITPELKGPGLIVSDLHFTRDFQEHRDRPKRNFLLNLIPRFSWAVIAGDGVTIPPGTDYQDEYRAISRTPWGDVWEAFSSIETYDLLGNHNPHKPDITPFFRDWGESLSFIHGPYNVTVTHGHQYDPGGHERKMNSKIGRAVRPLYDWAEKKLYTTFAGALVQMSYEATMKSYYHDVLSTLGPREIRIIGHGHIGCVMRNTDTDAYLYESGTFTTRRGSWITVRPEDERPKLYKSFFSAANKVEPFTRPLRRARIRDQFREQEDT